MNIKVQNFEESRRFFPVEGSFHPEGKNLKYRRLTRDFNFSIENIDFTIKEGFWWDGASIPQILWSILGDPWEEHVACAALVHDVLYATQIFPREYADKIFYEINALNGMGVIKNNLFYTGVRVGGKVAWDGKIIDSICGARKHLKMKLFGENYENSIINNMFGYKQLQPLC